MSSEIQAWVQVPGTFRIVDRGTVTIQPAGPAGKRQVFLILPLDTAAGSRQLEFVLSERAANQLGEALISGSVGLMREFNLADDTR